ncbi:MAG: ankyrin repeat domain-containing protein [Myxococcota bacterium]
MPRARSLRNAFVVTVSGRVRFWDHDWHRSTPAFESIDAFLAALVYHPEDEPFRYSATLDSPEAIEAFLSGPDIGVNAAHLGREAFRPAFDIVFARGGAVPTEYLVGAAYSGDLQLVKDIAARGVSLDGVSPGSGTPLASAAEGDNLEVAQWLLENGADPSILMSWGETASESALYGSELRALLLRATAEAADRD